MADQMQTGAAADNNYEGIDFNHPFTVQDVNRPGGNTLSLSLLTGGINPDQVMNYLRAGSPILFCPPDAVQHLTGNAPAGGKYDAVDFTQRYMVNEVTPTGDRIALRVTIPAGVNWDEAREYLKDGRQILAVPPDAIRHLTQGRAASAGAGGTGAK